MMERIRRFQYHAIGKYAGQVIVVDYFKVAGKIKGGRTRVHCDVDKFNGINLLIKVLALVEHDTIITLGKEGWAVIVAGTTARRVCLSVSPQLKGSSSTVPNNSTTG
jgi:hypothetical protein